MIDAWRARHPDWFEMCLIAFGPGECEGWADLLDEALDELDFITRQHPAGTLRLKQMKEKFGSLRVYFRRDIGSPVDAAIEAILSDLRDQSECVCQLCGSVGALGSHQGCMVVRCSKCAGKA